MSTSCCVDISRDNKFTPKRPYVSRYNSNYSNDCYSDDAYDGSIYSLRIDLNRNISASPVIIAQCGTSTFTAQIPNPYLNESNYSVQYAPNKKIKEIW